MAQDLCARLREKKLISIVRGAPTEKITKIADAIYRGGFRFMEITFDQSGKTPHAVTAEQIRIVREAFDGRLHVGAGTVMTEAQLKLAAEAGAEYIISPNVDTAIIRATKAAGLISIPGAFTPSEIAGAYQAGADFVKLFPADCVDLKYIKAVRAPINHIPLLAVSGVTPENLGDYLKAGMAGAGIGSILVTRARTWPPTISRPSRSAPRAMSLWSKASDPIAGSQKPGWRLQHQPGDITPAHPREGRAGIFVGS